MANILSKLFGVTKASRPKALSGPHYKVVSAPFTLQRDQASIETKDEMDYLDFTKRMQLLDHVRNAVRNSPSINAILRNVCNAVIGPNGGKIIWTGDENPEMERLVKLFRRWTRSCEFFDGVSFREFLNLVLTTLIISGDCCVVWGGDIRNTDRVLLFESDEIGGLSPEDLARTFGANFTQRCGRVYDAYGAFSGCIVSKSQRGKEIFDRDKSYILKAGPTDSIFDRDFFFPRLTFRTNQVRGISPLACSIASALDLEDVYLAECATTKKASQILMQIVDQDAAQAAQASVPSAFDAVGSMTDEEIQAAAQSEAASTKVLSWDTVSSIGANTLDMTGTGAKIDMVDPTHPNLDTIHFIQELQARICVPLGLAGYWASMDGAGSDALAQQMSWQTIYTHQKNLEQLEDWIFSKFVQFHISNGDVSGTIPEDYLDYVKWEHPRMEQLDPVKNEQKIAMALKNMSSTYQEILGYSWREKLEQTRNEIDWLKKNNLPIPQYDMVSGGEKTGADAPSESGN